MKKYLLSLESSEIFEWFQSISEKSFRAKQLLEWLYKKNISDFDKMTNFSARLRETLKEAFEVGPLKLVKVQGSQDQETQKFLWELEDGNLVESVLIRAPDRLTVCVSSQVGCPARCSFCASGKEGFFRNLSAGEIVSQVYEINKHLQETEEGKRVSHVVYMGMGEPFRNYDNVCKSIRILIHEDMFHLSQRRITVSTVGVIEGIAKFSEEDFRVNLVLSLHAPNQHLRKKIIPFARTYELDDILAAMDEYAAKTKRDITYEYTLLSGINDGENEAKELVKLLRGKQCTINLIPYNPVEGLKLKRPETSAIKRFRQILDQGHIVNTCRYTKGDDIAAACGQLALQQKTSSQPSLVVLK